MKKPKYPTDQQLIALSMAIDALEKCAAKLRSDAAENSKEIMASQAAVSELRVAFSSK